MLTPPSLPAELADTPFAGSSTRSEVGAGWTPILVDLHRALHEIDPHYTVGQYKEKFGALRVYASATHPDLNVAVRAALDVAEARSLTVCEECGAPGRRRPTGWIRTLCDEHAAEHVARQEL